MSLLGPNDPAPVAWVNPDSAAPVLLLCEHAGQAVPAALGGLGLNPGEMDTHIGWDIGAEALARTLATRLGAPLILQRYSRLVIDCNRPPGTPQSVPVESDATPVPANARASAGERAARVGEIFAPLDAAITEGFARHPRRAAFSVHSFTPRMAGVDRPWQAGFLTRADTATGQALIDHIAQAAPGQVLGLNQPYQIDESTDWFIPRHCEPRGVLHSLIEIRNDQLADAAGVHHWADRLAGAIAHLLEATA